METVTTKMDGIVRSAAKLKVRSRPVQGTTFTVTLPIARLHGNGER